MVYADPDDVRVALTPGGDDTDVGSAASMSDDDLIAAVSDATDEVNAKLSARYTVPFNPVPDLVKTITVRIAAYLATLTARRGDPILAGDPVLLGYQRAEMLLTQLQNGAATLDIGDTPPAESMVASPVVVNQEDGDLFTPADFPIEPASPFGWPGGSLTRP